MSAFDSRRSYVNFCNYFKEFTLEGSILRPLLLNMDPHDMFFEDYSFDL